MFTKLQKIQDDPSAGKLITFDGVDGSGKTTMLEMLAEHLKTQGKDVLMTTQPTPEMREFRIFKKYIYQPEERHLVDYRALQLFMIADRLQHIKEVIEPALKEGKHVICDRYIFTMLATLIARGNQPEAWLNEVLKYVPLPQFAFIMDVDLDTAIYRIKQRKTFEDSYVEREHLQKSIRAYQLIGEHFDLQVIDSSQYDIPQAFNKIRQAIS